MLKQVQQNNIILSLFQTPETSAKSELAPEIKKMIKTRNTFSVKRSSPQAILTNELIALESRVLHLRKRMQMQIDSMQKASDNNLSSHSVARELVNQKEGIRIL